MENKTVSELRDVARNKKLSGYSKLKKADLIDFIKHHRKKSHKSSSRKNSRKFRESRKGSRKSRKSRSGRKGSRSGRKQYKLTSSRKKLIEQISALTGQTPYQLQDMPTAELKRYVQKEEKPSRYGPNSTIQYKLTPSRKRLIEEVSDITGQTPYQLQKIPTSELEKYAKKASKIELWKGERTVFDDEGNAVKVSSRKTRKGKSPKRKSRKSRKSRRKSLETRPRLTDVRRELIRKVSGMTGQTPYQLQDLPTSELKRYVDRSSPLDVWEGKRTVFTEEGSGKKPLSKERMNLIKRASKASGKSEEELMDVKPSELRKMVPRKSR